MKLFLGLVIKPYLNNFSLIKPEGERLFFDYLGTLPAPILRAFREAAGKLIEGNKGSKLPEN